jgi:hypothetical protein
MKKMTCGKCKFFGGECVVPPNDSACRDFTPRAPVRPVMAIRRAIAAHVNRNKA